MFYGMLLMLAFAEASQAAKPVTKAAPAKTPPAKTAKASVKKAGIAPLVLPSEATVSGPNQWTHTDAAGKEWIYRQGPFGLTRMPKVATASNESRLHEGITVVEEGDQVRFSRQGPFGLTSWTKKLDEVNEVERAAIEKSRAARQKQ
jgi:hypothetical protein